LTTKPIAERYLLVILPVKMVDVHTIPPSFNGDGNSNLALSESALDESMLPLFMKPSLDSDAISAYVAHVLDILPDVEPDYLNALVVNTITSHGSGALERVLDVLFEDPKYPKVDLKGKGKRKATNDDNDDEIQAQNPSKRSKLDYGYGNMSRAFMGGPDYATLALVP
jgi:hypothetical protein